ncbi:MAG: response regulator [Candidatus Marinimicrobia bacterium]|jgi:CheY-like chemotaxis protein|nr:response regulator [Candidatus Neomarinimicrobiota bacterium]MBT4361671.1 response regulator [Candidatus Neomarinimicrobiota bacterium]MBT4715135.1 response regulator [Candidatus Neomarinimicrobiota bacterium]MBT4945730.1 response regulator [Candidatus Neomarinimicrobiota bacterium]MBT5271155.1 response regulator [Candidatus Neomarinimicrobiota bacterium]
MKQQQLHAIIMESLAFERAVLPANIEMKQDIDMNCGSILCDKTQIQQIVINLCNNAKHAMAEKGGTLTVDLHQVRTSFGTSDTILEALELKISDTGHGRDAETLTKVIDPFLTIKGVGGTGLRLSAINGIIELMNGHISVISEIGEGTTYIIQFPVGIEHEEVTSIRSKVQTPSSFQCILLVDDETSIRDSIQRILIRKGFTVDSAEDGKQALDLFLANSGRYDLIVTDLSMPIMSGADLTVEIRKRGLKIPIILSTGNLGTADQEGYSNIGIDVCLKKPWTAEELIACIREFGA